MMSSPVADADTREDRPDKIALDRQIKAERRAVLVVNTRSCHGADAYAEAKRRLTSAGITLEATYPVRHPERIHAIIAEEIAKQRRYVIVGGGDGTISSVSDAFAYAGVVLGILPLGTANSFARTIGIPLDLEGAIDVLLNGKVVDVDLGTVNEHYFANGSSIGMPPIVGRATPPALKRWFGRSAYGLVAAEKFIHYAAFSCIVSIEGEEKTFEALEVRIANGAYQGGILVAKEANPDDGRIVLHILEGPSKWTLAKEWARVALGAPFERADIEILRAPSFVIHTVPKQHVAVDGEVVTQTPVRVAVARKALLLMAPQTFRDL